MIKALDFNKKWGLDRIVESILESRSIQSLTFEPNNQGEFILGATHNFKLLLCKADSSI